MDEVGRIVGVVSKFVGEAIYMKDINIVVLVFTASAL